MIVVNGEALSVPMSCLCAMSCPPRPAITKIELSASAKWDALSLCAFIPHSLWRSHTYSYCTFCNNVLVLMCCLLIFAAFRTHRFLRCSNSWKNKFICWLIYLDLRSLTIKVSQEQRNVKWRHTNSTSKKWQWKENIHHNPPASFCTNSNVWKQRTENWQLKSAAERWFELSTFVLSSNFFPWNLRLFLI